MKSGSSCLVVADMDFSNSKDGLNKWMQQIQAQYASQKVVFAFYCSDPNKKVVSEKKGVICCNDKDFSIFGGIKKQDLKDVVNKKYDILLAFGDFSKRMVKTINKTVSRVRVGTNVSNELNCTIKLQLKSKEISQMSNFTAEMIRKLAF